MMKQLLAYLLVGLPFTLAVAQGGGMWIPNELNVSDMQSLGMQLSQEDVFDTTKPSLKDAIAHFNGGCTSEVISPKGLLLTNHHCGYGQIQSHSTVEHNYLEDGFWAESFKDELPNENLTASFIVDIIEVTDQILPKIKLKSEDLEQEYIKNKIDALVASAPRESYQDAYIKPFYKGNQYYLFITETFRDVRLVGAPPSSIGKFGSDTDNWVWPRHTGDFSIFRIYSDKNNRPADYSVDNVPYTPKHYLPVNIGGVEDNDFTMVLGFPGSTNEYLPAIALQQIVEKRNPVKIKIRETALDIMDEAMRSDEATKIQYASKFAGIANYWKKWIGESQGLNKSNAVAIKKTYEERFNQKLNEKCKLEKSKECVEYGNSLSKLNQLYTEIEPLYVASDYFDEAIYRNSETFRIALLLNNLLSKEDNKERQDYLSRITPYLNRLYKDYNPVVDQKVSLAVWDLYKDGMEEKFIPKENILTGEDFKNSYITGQNSVEGISLSTNPEAFLNNPKALEDLANDPIFRLVGATKDLYEDNVSKSKRALQTQIDKQLKSYMAAQLDVMSDEQKFFPDANSTLRVTYGVVKDYSPRDAVIYKNTSSLKGVAEKYKEGDYEFDVPQKLLDLYNTKDFGQYADGDDVAVNFIATNHTTGGNSGSPALDAKGNLIGLNFDRVWEGTMSDYYFDPSISRNIMVDARYILFIIDKYANATRLIDEMEIVKE